MANNHSLFTEFNSIIRLDDQKRSYLRGHRKALKKKIINYFNENLPDEIKPIFVNQGSLEMNTTVNPIPIEIKDGNKTKKIYKYDLDCGVYFIGGEEDRNEISTYHTQIYQSVENHTNNIIKKKTCIRLIYSDGHHIDLPIYFKKNDIPELAHRSNGWIKSDPEGFVVWFNNQAKENQQLRRIVRYLKAWKNYRETVNSGTKLPSGFILTILASNYYKENERDDIALCDTVKKIKEKLDYNFTCYRPTVPTDEDLFEDYSDTKETYFLDSLKNFTNNLAKAIEENNFKKASENIKKSLGERFPLGKDENEDERISKLSSIIGTPLASKPYLKR